MVFIAVSGLMTISESTIATRKVLTETDSDLSAQISNDMISLVLVMFGIATLAVAIGHGLTAHVLRDRKPWARPLGFTFSGILLGLAAVSLLTGAFNMPTFFFAVGGLLGISLISKPQVRDYLQPNRPQPGPGRFPPGPPGPPGPPVHPGPHGHPQNHPQNQHAPAQGWPLHDGSGQHPTSGDSNNR